MKKMFRAIATALTGMALVIGLSACDAKMLIDLNEDGSYAMTVDAADTEQMFSDLGITCNDFVSDFEDDPDFEGVSVEDTSAGDTLSCRFNYEDPNPDPFVFEDAGDGTLKLDMGAITADDLSEFNDGVAQMEDLGMTVNASFTLRVPGEIVDYDVTGVVDGDTVTWSDFNGMRDGEWVTFKDPNGGVSDTEDTSDEAIALGTDDMDVEENSDSSNTALIIGLIAVALLAIIAAIVVVVVILRRGKKGQDGSGMPSYGNFGQPGAPGAPWAGSMPGAQDAQGGMPAAPNSWQQPAPAQPAQFAQPMQPTQQLPQQPNQPWQQPTEPWQPPQQ